MSEREGSQRERAQSERGLSVAIVGLGSRGLSVLERIATLASRAGPAAGPVRVEIVDPTCAGAGIHQTGQPDYLLLNTTCGQVSMFPDTLSVGADVGEPGPSLHEWVTGRGLRLAEDGFTVGARGRPIRPTDFLPRSVLGEYLGWFLDEVRRRVPDHVRLAVHRAAAVDISADPGGELEVALSDGTRLRVGYAFMTTGYTPNDRTVPARLVAEPYPLPDRVADIGPAESVAIGGFGLSAMDVISCLTVGRGGRFVADQGGLRYLPSGREPTLLLYSRSGVPCRARPLRVEFGPRYQPLVFTRTGIDALRLARGGPLDFDADVLPLILTEMRVAYRRCQARCEGGAVEASITAALASSTGRATLAAALDDLDARLGPFDPAAALDGSTGMLLDDSTAYQGWLADAVRADLADGVLGFTRSPVKAALDILRDLRDMIRYAVDFGGLTGDSLDAFIGRIVPLINRAVVGPQYERHTELLALFEAGVAGAPFGPAPAIRWDGQAGRAGRWTMTSTALATPCEREVDWLVHAHVPAPAVETSASPLIRALHRKGWIRPHRPGSSQVPGIDLDADQHPLDARGLPQRRLWVLGPLCEGATYYNNLVPSPSVYSRPLHDAHRCVAAMFAAAAAGDDAPSAAAPLALASSGGHPVSDDRPEVYVSEREGGQRERGATRTARPAVTRAGLAEERTP
jgi:uncharacterized NAD(P)/FAD-binding protein YdhS